MATMGAASELESCCKIRLYIWDFELAIQRHPPLGSILLCDFGSGFKIPEMVKRRPVIVLSPPIARRVGLCTVVALSTTDPKPAMPFHARLDMAPLLPPPWDIPSMWVKGDMVNAVAFHRLDFVRAGKDENGKRLYYTGRLDARQLREVRSCVLRSLGLMTLTKHL